MNKSWYSLKSDEASKRVSVSIYDYIGAYGVSARDFIEELQQVSDSAETIVVSINSYGGEVMDALAIHNYLFRIRDKITIVVEGVAASAATFVTSCGGKVVMPENSFLMIHAPSSFAWGDSDDMAGVADVLGKIESSMISIYARKTGAEVDTVKSWLANETWFSASEALDVGLADEIEGPIMAAASWNVNILAKSSACPKGFGVAITDQKSKESTVEKDGSVSSAPPSTPLALAKKVEAGGDQFQLETMLHARALIVAAGLNPLELCCVEDLKSVALGKKSIEQLRSELIEQPQPGAQISNAISTPDPSRVGSKIDYDKIYSKRKEG